MASDRNKRMGLTVGLALSAVSGGVAAWLTNLQLGHLLGGEGSGPLPEYQPPPESPLAGQPVTILPPSEAGGMSGPSTGAVAQLPSRPGLGDFSSITFRNIFDSEATGRSDAPETEPIESEGETEPSQTRLGPLCVYVLHTLDAEPQRYAWALISKDKRGSDQEIFRIGDEVFEQGSQLVRVSLREIEVKRRDDSSQVFQVGGECETGATAPPSREVVEAKPDGEESAGGVGDGIEQVGENKFVIPADEIDKAMGNLEQLAKDARVVPHYQNGQIVGFKVFRIKAGSVYSKLGLKNGDIIERINGQDINSPERALALYQTLRNEKGFQLDLRRRNQPLTLDYEVK